MEETNGPATADALSLQPITRRRLMEAGVWASAAVAGTVMAGVGGRFVVGKTLDVVPGQWVSLGELSTLPTDAIQQVNYVVSQRDAWRRVEKQGILYVLHSAATDEYLVLDATCTHLGCTVRWDGAQEHFACPCHDAHFDQRGAVVSGPPPRGLRQLAVKIEAGALWAEV